jgi:hypothetical protein
MLNWQDIVMKREQYQDLLREAQRDRLVKQAQQSCEPGHSFYRQAFTWLGKRLVCWGLSLQARSGSTPATLEPARQAC